MARRCAKRAPQRVFQRMNITLQPAPKFATMPGSHAVPVGGMGPSHHARFTQELSFGHWKPFRSSLPEGAIGTRAPPQQAQSEPPTAGSHASRSGASHEVQSSLGLFEIVTLDADLSVPAPVSMGQSAGSRFAQSPPLGGRPPAGQPSAYAAENGSRLHFLPHTLTISSNQPILWSYLVVSCARPCSQQEPAFPESS